MLGRLMPREGKFFELFNAHAARIAEGSHELAAMMNAFNELEPVGGFCAETGGAGMLLFATALGIPVSTTHTITGAIVGVVGRAPPVCALSRDRHAGGAQR
jgi:hypothetical protein